MQSLPEGFKNTVYKWAILEISKALGFVSGFTKEKNVKQRL